MTKKKRSVLKFLFIVLAFITISLAFSNAFAAINENYKIDARVVDADLDKKAKSSILLDAIGNLIYVLASFGEWLIGIIFEAVSSTVPGQDAHMTFPWADAIIFNAVEVLDINFLNASDGSIIKIIYSVIQKIYGTIFGISISFFSIAVLIMGIKLAISTIASEKARYKQAAWDWMIGLVLLFTIHFFISFVFYLNEQLVETASGIVTKEMEDAEKRERLYIDATNESAEANAVDTLKKFTEQMKNASWHDFTVGWNGDFKVLSKPSKAFIEWRLNESKWEKDSNGEYKYPNTWWGINDLSKQELNTLDVYSLSTLSPSLSDFDDQVNYLMSGEPAKVAAQLLINSDYMKYRMPGITPDQSVAENELKWWQGFIKSNNKNYVTLLCFDVYNVVNNIDTYKLLANMRDSDINYEQKQFGKVMVSVVKNHQESGSGEKLMSDSLIYNLASYFKVNSWGVVGGGGWGTSKVVLQNAIMYAILVVQSFIFLIAYIKRLFYVIMLALMAPVVVVYDFFNKSIS